MKEVNLTPVEQALKDMLWDALRRDPEHKDRRKLPPKWGTKTVKGLAASIVRVVREAQGTDALEAAAKAVIKYHDDDDCGFNSDDEGYNLLGDLRDAVEAVRS